VTGNGKDFIDAEDFEHGIRQGALDAEAAKALALANGRYFGGGDIDFEHLIVDTADGPGTFGLDAINAAIDAGVKGDYQLTFRTPGPSDLGANPGFTPQDTQASVTVTVTLRDAGDAVTGDAEDPSDDGQRIYGDDFAYAVTAGAITEAEAIDLANISLYEYDGDNILTDLDPESAIADADELAALNEAIRTNDKSGNPYPLTFTSPDGEASVTVLVTLFDDIGGGNGEGGGASGAAYIGANDFAYALKDAPGLTEAVAKALSGVAAKDGKGNAADVTDPAKVSVDAGQFAAVTGAASSGRYPLSFTYTPDTGAAVAARVTVTLFDHGPDNPDPDDPAPPPPPTPGEPALWANDFSYGVDGPALTAGIAKDLSGVTGIDTRYNAVPAKGIGVTEAHLDAVNAAIEVGAVGTTHPLTFTYDERNAQGDIVGSVSVTVNVTLRGHGPGPIPTDPGDPAPYPGPDRLTADDFSYGLDEAAPTEEIAKQLSRVSGTDGYGGHVPDGDITASSGMDELIAAHEAGNPGEYPLVFTTENGGEIAITVTLKDRGSAPEGQAPDPTKDHITGNDFLYGTDEGALTPDTAKHLADVDAVDKDGRPIDPNEITADPDELAAINEAIENGVTGEYPLTFTTPDGESVTVTVTLRDNGAGNTDPGKADTERIAANDFAYGIDEGTFTADIAKALSSVKADRASGAKIPIKDIKANAVELAAVEAARKAGNLGVYPLAFATPDGTSVTISVTLTHHGKGGVDPDPSDPRLTSAHITGNDFGYACNLPDLTAGAARTLGMVGGIDKGGNRIAAAKLVPDSAQLAAINAAKNAGRTGGFPLAFTGPDDTSVTLTVTLYDGGSPVPPDPAPGIPAVMGDNFTYNVANPVLTASIVKALSKAAGRDASGFPVPRSGIAVDAADLAVVAAAQRAGVTGVFRVGLAHGGAEHRISVTLVKDEAPLVPPVPPTPAAPAAPTPPASVVDTVVSRVSVVTTRIAADMDAGASTAGENLAGVINGISEEIAEGATPLGGGAGGAWALVNLLLAVFGAALFLSAVLFAPRRREADERRDVRRRGGLWMPLSLIAAAFGVLFFLLTEDITASMRMTDAYTAVQACVFAVSFIAALAGVRRRDNPTEETGETNPVEPIMGK
ncbi:MAG: hypothetical protein LBL63_05080, partial [Clostridiales Family XIII bacterium]|jgi:hypothetical protein|nr:hypothetical protein [Clostridiales Family XIII bacterium]